MKPWSSSASLAILLTAGCGVSFSAAVQPPATSPDAHSQIDAGKRIFAETCANCHGAAGIGALGPSLVNRSLSLDLSRNTIMNGRVGSAMPQFKTDLDAASLAEVIAYVQWLETGGSQPQAPIIVQEGAADPDKPSSQPISVGEDKGIPARGAELFFDPTRICSCRACHSFANRGGPVGPDLAGMNKTPAAVHRSIVAPKTSAPGFPAISLGLRDGHRLLGIRDEESDAVVVLYDVSSCPPVKRTISKSNIRELPKVGEGGIYDHTALRYSKQDLIDLSAYLGAAN
jgi:putative heme-binding domain-containing protein